MRSFNLFTVQDKKEVVDKNSVKLPNFYIGIFGLLFLVVFAAIACFVLNLYFDTQFTDKGNNMISLISQQNSYNSTISKIQIYSSRTSALDSILTDRLSYDEIIKNLDTLTNNSAIIYNLSKQNKSGTLNGVVTNPSDAVNVVTTMKKSGKYTNVFLNQITNTEGKYSYMITFNY